MTCQEWWKEALSKEENVSVTRTILIAVTVFAITLSTIAVIMDTFSAELAWFLLGLFTSACGLKGGQKIYEVRRELGKHDYGSSNRHNTYSGRPVSVAKGDNSGAGS